MHKKLNRQKDPSGLGPGWSEEMSWELIARFLQEFRLEEGDEYPRISQQINELFCFFNSLALCSHFRIQRDEKNCLADGVKPLMCGARHQRQKVRRRFEEYNSKKLDESRTRPTFQKEVSLCRNS